MNYLKDKKLQFAAIFTGTSISFYFIHRCLKKKVERNFNNYIHSILVSPDIEKDGITLLNKVITHPQTKHSIFTLIKSSLHDKEILTFTQNFTTNLLKDVLKEKQIQNLIHKNILLTFRDKKIRNEFVNLADYIMSQEKTKEVTKNFFLNVFEKNEIKKSFTDLMTDSAIATMRKSETKKNFSEFISDVWSDQNLRWNVFKRAVRFWSGTSR